MTNISVNKNEILKNLPSVDKILNLPEIKTLVEDTGKKLVLYAIRNSLHFFRDEIICGNNSPDIKDILSKINKIVYQVSNKSLKKVINATGIIIHTNLGRIPYGEDLINDSLNTLVGYNNLEFNLEIGNRGNRNDHAIELLKFITGAEDALIVNNNAAAVMLLLRTFAKNKEVIVSRGELIEIGGSFRIPEIMAASDCKMIEVGTTNKTNIEDFSNSVSQNTAVLFKAHKSNYQIKGFTEEASIDELVTLGKKKKIPVIYDIGSGLLTKTQNKYLSNEPTVVESVKKGIDLICFSGDKLLGGPQAGIIVGKKKLIGKLKKEPMVRALRVCKSTIALLETACSYYLNEEVLNKKNYVFQIFNKKPEEIKHTAIVFSERLAENHIDSEIVNSFGQTGGGTVPEGKIPSYSVKVIVPGNSKTRSEFAEKMYYSLLKHKDPVLSVLKKGFIYFDMLTLSQMEAEELSEIVSKVYSQTMNTK